MPRKKKLTEAQELALEFAQAKKELRQAEVQGKLYRRRDLKQARSYLSRLLGPAHVQILVGEQGKFGQEMVDRAVKAYAGRLAKTRAEKLKRITAYKLSLERRGFKKEDIARIILPKFKFKFIPRVEYHPIVYGRGKGKWAKKVGGIRVAVISKRKAKYLISHNRYQKRITGLANKLLISKREAGRIYKIMKDAAIADLRKFKKSPAFKAMKPRRRRLYNIKRWERGNLATLFKLLEIEWSP